LQWVAAAVSLVNVVFFRLQELLAPQSAELDRLVTAALVAVAVLSIGAILISRYLRGSPALRSGIALGLIVLTVLAGFAPRLVGAHRQAAVAAQHAAEDQQRDEAFATELSTWRATIAVQHPLAAEQSWAFVDFVSRASRYDDGADPPSAQALALLRT